jgi:haloalkane dehalogenase
MLVHRKPAMLKMFLCLIFFVSLTACASPPGNKFDFDGYVAQFNAAQPHQALSISRSDGYKISAREFGATHRGKLSTIILMHGFPDNQHLYDLLIPALSKNRHVISFDFLGWGNSEKPLKHLYDVASQRADLDAVIATQKLDAVVIVVHDLSGHAGIDWALDNQASTSALVLLNTYYTAMPTLKAPDAIEFYSTPGLLRDIATWGANKVGSRFESGLSGQIGKFFSNDIARDKFVPIIAHDAAAIRPAFFSSTNVLWSEIKAREQNLARIRQFNKPVHIIFGIDDPFLNKGVAESFGGLFPNSSLSLVPKAGHYVQLDEPDQVAALMAEKLAQQPLAKAFSN